MLGYHQNEMSMTVSIETDDGELVINAKYEVCPECDGHGKHSNHLGFFTTDMLGEDPDFTEDYFAGRYDKQCGTCKAKRVILVPNEALNTKEELAQWESAMVDLVLQRAEELAEMRAGC